MALQDTLKISERADFCVGYFNLRGWKLIDDLVDKWSGGEGASCRLLIGMQTLPAEELRSALAVGGDKDSLDQQTLLRLKKRVAEEFRQQLTAGVPSNEDEQGLRRLSAQIKAKKVVVRFSVKEPLHAKLYLLHRTDPNNPTIGFVGSSNLTMAGLSRQGELNVDILDQDACQKLQAWFNDRWNDRWSIEVSEDIAEAIDTSWARAVAPTPYQVYLKMAYHLSQEARAGLTEFSIPRDFGNTLLEFQTAAVKIAAHHLNARRGALIGDVVGLGKTLMATALARIYQDDFSTETLIICPKNLVPMWQDYVMQYRLIARVLSLSKVLTELPRLRRYRVVLIDESQNLRNRQGKRYRAIQEYIASNESRCILLSATPYNKTYLDLSSQLRLFVPEDKDLGVRPERIIKELGETEFIRQHQCPLNSLAAFETSAYPDDWRDLLRLFLVRRTRSFIKENYSITDKETGRKYLTFANGTRFYFPARVPRTVGFEISDKNKHDPYAKLYSGPIVDAIGSLRLPRYGLANYISPSPGKPPTPSETRVLNGLSRAGKRLMGFCRTNLFKRLESGGPAFIQSVERHIIRNLVVLHAMEKKRPIPIGTQEAELLDPGLQDTDAESLIPLSSDESEELPSLHEDEELLGSQSLEELRRRASRIYEDYATTHQSRFKWLSQDFFVGDLEKDLRRDVDVLMGVLEKCGPWDPRRDAKLSALERVITKAHPKDKVLIFTQFADTVDYLTKQLTSRGIKRIEGVTGDSPNPTEIAWRFSPVSSGKRQRIKPEDELRVLVATDVLSEGQNLQDGWIIVNYDLPWAIIRLVQRAGRVDRIGQTSDEIVCYSFLPADGVERIINLRRRVRRRLQENAEVLGTDEAFFEDERNDRPILDIYNEKAGVLDGEDDAEVDLASYAFQVWKNAVDRDSSLAKLVPELPNVVYSTKAHAPSSESPNGVLLFLRTSDGSDSLAWINEAGEVVTQSQLSILRAAECAPDTPGIPRDARHHALVQKGVEHLAKEERSVGGQLGRPSGARFRTYERLKQYSEQIKGTLFESQDLLRAIDDIYRYPLRQSAIDTLNRQLRSGVTDEELAALVLSLRDENRLCIVQEEQPTQQPEIICSMGLFTKAGGD